MGGGQREGATRRHPGRRGLRLLRLVLVALGLFGLLLLFPTPYALRAPGRADPVSPMVSIPARKTYPAVGELYITTVAYDRANLLFLLYSLFDRHTELLPLRDTPLGREPEYEEQMADQMKVSQYLATVAALNHLGYSIRVRPVGARVLRLREDSPARGLLRPGDLIVGAAGREVLGAPELQMLVREWEAGRPLPMAVRRGGERREVEVPTLEQEGQTRIGAEIRTEVERPDLPFAVRIDPGKVDGASAGLLFALQILNALTPQDLTRGWRVAGTGTMEADGTVGEVSGADLKAVAARRAGIRFFLCPEVNAAEARSAGSDLRVIPVRTLEEALQALRKLEP